MYANKDGTITLEGAETLQVKFIEEWLALYHDAAEPVLLLNVNDRVAGLPAVVGVAGPLRLAEAIFNAVVSDANGHRDRVVGYQLCLTSWSALSKPLEDKPRLSITVDRDGKSCFCPPRNAEVKEVAAVAPAPPVSPTRA